MAFGFRHCPWQGLRPQACGHNCDIRPIYNRGITLGLHTTACGQELQRPVARSSFISQVHRVEARRLSVSTQHRLSENCCMQSPGPIRQLFMPQSPAFFAIFGKERLENQNTRHCQKKEKKKENIFLNFFEKVFFLENSFKNNF